MLSKYSHYVAILAIAAVCEISASTLFLADVRGQMFEPPAGNPTPTTSIGGGRRGNDGECLRNRGMKTGAPASQSPEHPLTPLLPPNKFGLTISPYPQFFAYIPKTSAIAVEFTLENQQGKGIAQKRIALTSTPSIVSFQFQETPLEVGKDYKWLVSLVCETGDPEDVFAEGIVRRITPESTLTKKLATVSVTEQVHLLAKSGVWYDAIAGLVNLQLSQPNSADLKTSWQNLLKSTSLENLANAPLQK